MEQETNSSFGWILKWFCQ